MTTKMTIGEKMVWAVRFARALDSGGGGGIAAKKAAQAVQALRRPATRQMFREDDEVFDAQAAVAMVDEMLQPDGWINDPFARLDAIGADPNHPSYAVVREAIESKIDPPTPRDRLLEIRKQAQGNSRWLDDLEFLLKLAVDQDDPYEDGPSDPEALAARIQAMVLGNAWEDYLPRPPAPPREPRKRPAPIGPLIKVDVYECAEGHPGVRVEVERVPGSDDAKVGAHMEMEWGAPTCPNCERDMVQVERKLRKMK